MPCLGAPPVTQYWCNLTGELLCFVIVLFCCCLALAQLLCQMQCSFCSNSTQWFQERMECSVGVSEVRPFRAWQRLGCAQLD
jgi:hypothetical protein